MQLRELTGAETDGRRTGATLLVRGSVRCVGVLLVLIASFALDGPVRASRATVLHYIPRGLLLLVSEFGDVSTLAVVLLVLLGVGLLTRRRKLTCVAALLAAAFTAAAAVVGPLKWLASRDPNGVFHGFGAAKDGILFPSGHAALALAAGAVIAAAWRWARWPAFALALIVAFSRVVLFHFLSDVVAGTLIGAAIGAGVSRWAIREGLLKTGTNRRPPSRLEPAEPARDGRRGRAIPSRQSQPNDRRHHP
jgi:undecaprenyl-diphosphatase